MPLNLNPIRRTIEKEMVDELRIIRNDEGTRIAEFDPESGTYNDPVVVLYEGIGLILPITSSPSQEPEGGGEARYTQYTLMIPLEGSPDLLVRDEIYVIASARDIAIVGKTFLVESPEYSTFPVARSAQISLRLETANA